MKPKSKAPVPKPRTPWDRVTRVIHKGRLSWQINTQDKRIFRGVPDGCRQWIEWYLEQGYLRTKHGGSIEIVMAPNPTAVDCAVPLIEHRIRQAQRHPGRSAKRGCDLDTDGDSNCYLHPKGCLHPDYQ